MKRKQCSHILGAVCTLMLATTPVVAASAPASVAQIHPAVRYETDPESSATICNFVDPAGYIVATQTVPAGSEIASDDDFDLPAGYLLATPGQSYNSTSSMVDIPVITDDTVLNTIYGAQKKDSTSALTVNLWLPDGTLVNSQTFKYYRAAGGGTPVYTLDTNYAVNVPAGYILTSDVPSSVQIPANTRGVLDLYVQYDGTEADGSPAALQKAMSGVTYKGEEVSASIANALGNSALAGPAELNLAVLSSSQTSQNASQPSTNTTSTTTVKKSPDTAVFVDSSLYSTLLAISGTTLAGTGFTVLRKKKH